MHRCYSRPLQQMMLPRLLLLVAGSASLLPAERNWAAREAAAAAVASEAAVRMVAELALLPSIPWFAACAGRRGLLAIDRQQAPFASSAAAAAAPRQRPAVAGTRRPAFGSLRCWHRRDEREANHAQQTSCEETRPSRRGRLLQLRQRGRRAVRSCSWRRALLCGEAGAVGRCCCRAAARRGEEERRAQADLKAAARTAADCAVQRGGRDGSTTSASAASSSSSLTRLPLRRPLHSATQPALAASPGLTRGEAKIAMR